MQGCLIQNLSLIDIDEVHFYLYTRWEQACEMYNGAYIPEHFMGIKLDRPLTQDFVNKRILRERSLTIMNEVFGVGQIFFGKDYIPGHTTKEKA